MVAPSLSVKAGKGKVAIEQLEVSAYVIPTGFPEADGTLQWNKTTLVVVKAKGGGRCSLGYTYADMATAQLITDRLCDVVRGRDAMAVKEAWVAIVHALRNLGQLGIVSMAISAVDNALSDLKARLLDLPLVTMLGPVRKSVRHAFGFGHVDRWSRLAGVARHIAKDTRIRSTNFQAVVRSAQQNEERSER